MHFATLRRSRGWRRSALKPSIEGKDALGLAGAAEELVRHFDEPRGECRYTSKLIGALPHPDEATAIAAYRILQ
jgi:hypothetical protein